jgi:sugar phosphate isomerase/epimerase
MLHRRDILIRAASLSSISLLTDAWLPSNATAIEPLQRPKPGQLRLALAAYSMREYMKVDSEGNQEMNLFQFVDYCRSLGVDGAELTSYYFPNEFGPELLAKLKLHCQKAGVTISGGAIRNNFCQADGPGLEADIEHTKLWIDRYSELGVSAIRVFAGSLPKGAELEETLTRCAKNLQKVCDYAARKGMILALENHGGVTATAEGLLTILRQVESEALAVNFDSGNFRSSLDPYAELAQIAPYAVNAQIKVEIFPDGVRQPTDLKRVLSILRDAGYSGWVALEYEAKEEPTVAIPRWIEELKTLIHA